MLASLEAGLHSNWGRDELAVYADYLQSLGDPRGELIAIDLDMLRLRDSVWSARRRELIVEWVGAALADTIEGKLFQGFIQTVSGAETALLESRAGDVIRALDVSGSPAAVRKAIATVVKTPRPWLGRMRLAVTGSPKAANEYCVDDELVAQLVAATPRLAELAIDGRRVIETLDHPALRHISTTANAVDSIVVSNVTLPGTRPMVLERLHGGTAAAPFTRLDLSRDDLKPNALIALLAEPALRALITHVRIRVIENVPVAALRGLHALQEVELRGTADRTAQERFTFELEAAYPRLRVVVK